MRAYLNFRHTYKATTPYTYSFSCLPTKPHLMPTRSLPFLKLPHSPFSLHDFLFMPKLLNAMLYMILLYKPYCLHFTHRSDTYLMHINV